MVKKLLLTVVIGFCATSSVSAQQYDDCEKLLGRDRPGWVMDRPGMIACYSSIIKKKPRDPEAYYRRGYWYLMPTKMRTTAEKTVDADMAIADLNKAIELKFPGPGVYSSRARAYMDKKEFEKAIADYSKYLLSNPTEVVSLNDRSEAYLELGKLELALADADKSVKNLTSHPPHIRMSSLSARGKVFEALGRRDEAISDFREILAMYPNLLWAKQALARLGAAP